MAAFDKAVRVRWLEQRGWKNIKTVDNPYMMIPPKGMFGDLVRFQSFYVYDATKLHGILMDEYYG